MAFYYSRGPLGPVNSPLVVRLWPGHLNVTQGNPYSLYQQPEDHLEAISESHCKALSENRLFGGFFEKMTKMARMALQCQDMVPECFKS